MQLRSVALTMLTLLAVLYTLYFARAVLMPFTVALLLYLLLSPLVHRLKRWHIPASLSAATLLVALVVGLASATYFLLDPAKEWLREAPTNLRQLAREIDHVKAPLEEIKEFGEEVGQMTELDSKQPKPQKVEIKELTALDRVMKSVPTVLASVLVILFTAFFMLASGDRLAHKTLTFGRSWQAKRKIIKASREIQGELSRHLLTITLINAILGMTVGLIMWALDVPNPELWGTMVAVLNFAPYVGAVVSAMVLTLVGISTFPTLSEALMVPGAFLLVTSLEGALFTPLVLGQRLSLSPLVVFLSVIMWGWVWGVAGALIAVPLMSSAKVLMSHVEATKPLARMMEA
jgi:predicted PurR-regulated permease PerM